MRESVSRPGPHGPQSQPHNGQPGAGTSTRDPVQGGTQELGPAILEVLGEGRHLCGI